MAGLHAPLPTLRSHPRGGLRTDRGRRGLLLLHRSGLSPHTPCRSPGALTRVAACTLARSPYFVTRYPKASDISSPPCLLRLLPAGANRRVGLAPTGKRRLVTAHPHSGHWPAVSEITQADGNLTLLLTDRRQEEIRARGLAFSAKA